MELLAEETGVEGVPAELAGLVVQAKELYLLQFETDGSAGPEQQRQFLAWWFSDDGNLAPYSCGEGYRVPLTALREAAAMLRQARRIFLLGHDVSLPAVQFLRLRLHYLGFHAIQLELADRGQLLLSLSQAGPEDLFVAISFPSHAPELARVGEYLRQQGVPLLAITDQPAAPVAACADRALTCATGDLLFYNTLTPPVSLINLLCSFLALEAGEGLQQTRRGVEEAFEAVFADDGAPPAEREPRAVLLAGEGRG